MKTKIIALFAILALAFVGLNTTSCSKDDNDSSSTSDSASLGKTDGTAFANAYATYKAKGYASVDGISAITTMLKYGTKYRNSNDKAYKAGFIAAYRSGRKSTYQLVRIRVRSSSPHIAKIFDWHHFKCESRLRHINTSYLR